jgi:hypothetical protein
MVWRGLSDYVISSGRGDGDKNGGCPIPTPKAEANIGVPASPGAPARSTSVLRGGDGGLSARLISLIRAINSDALMRGEPSLHLRAPSSPLVTAAAPAFDERHLGQEPHAGLRLGCFGERPLKHRAPWTISPYWSLALDLHGPQCRHPVF